MLAVDVQISTNDKGTSPEPFDLLVQHEASALSLRLRLTQTRWRVGEGA
jgi:hypothetical protein